jgi:hypothetical protein
MIARVEEDGTERLLEELRWGRLGGRPARGVWRRGAAAHTHGSPRPAPLPLPRGLVARLKTDPNMPLDDKIKGLRQKMHKM